MIELAERAVVSLATPYNLFGSKQAILQELVLEESECLQKKSVKIYFGEVHRYMVSTSNNVVSIFIQNSNFYRDLSRTLTFLASDAFRNLILIESNSIFRSLIDVLINEGAVQLEIEPETINAHLLRICSSTFFLWAPEG